MEFYLDELDLLIDSVRIAMNARWNAQLLVGDVHSEARVWEKYKQLDRLSAKLKDHRAYKIFVEKANTPDEPWNDPWEVERKQREEGLIK